MPAFARYFGIDYSGAETPAASLKGLRVYLAEGDVPPAEMPPSPSPPKMAGLPALGRGEFTPSSALG